MIRLRLHDVQLEPIEQWPGKATKYPFSSKFKAPFAATQQLLDRELKHLGAKRVVVQMCVTRADFRVDGSLRTGAKIRQPGVILRFEGKHGPVTIPCDRWNDWQDNVRAIALALEALRAVDRYGVTASGEQYRGWQALPAPSPTSVEAEIRTEAEALAFLKKLVTEFAVGSIDSAAAIRKAQFLTHPDRHGDPLDFKRVMRCEQLLRGSS